MSIDLTLSPKQFQKMLENQMGEVAATRFLLDCLQQVEQLPLEAENRTKDNSGLKTANPRLYGNFRRECREELKRFKETLPTGKKHKLKMVDFGGGAGETAGFRDGFEYSVLDVNPLDPEAISIVHDVNEPCPIESETIDVVFCNQVFEHLTTPWVTAKEIGRVLRPGGICLVSTVFAYRYHPYPGDFWRFTHAGLKRLMEEYGKLNTISAKYELTHRRDDRRGALGHQDEVHIDWLGGFRENWFVYHIGRKPINL